MAKRMTQQEALGRLKDLFKRQANFTHERIDQTDLNAIKIAYKALQREVDEENANNKFFDEIIEKMEKQMNDMKQYEEYKDSDLIYIQWYPSQYRAGFVAQHPSKEDLEEFYDNVNASDPHHNSFVIIILEEKHIGLLDINKYVKDNILKCFFGN